MTLSVAPLHPLFAAEVGGVDLSIPFGASAPFGEATGRALREALRARRLLVFRGQRLSAAEQVAFTRILGTVDLHAVAGLRSPGQPEIVVEPAPSAADANGFRLGDLRWHADQSWTPRPNRFSALYAPSVPPTGGAATLFADQCAAFDRLDPWLAHRVQFLEAEHDPGLRFGEGGTDEGAPAPVAHPVVRVDPETGRRGLFVDEDTTTRLLGVPEPEATRLLRRLCAAATDPAVTYRHAWRPGDLVVWDNHAVLHRAASREAGQAWQMRRTMATSAGRLYGPAAVTHPWVVAG